MTSDRRPPRDAGNWAQRVDRLTAPDGAEAHAFGVEGRRVAGPQQGFGALWDRDFTVALGDAATPAQVIADWRARFGDFWPRGGTFYGAITALEAGDVAPLTAGGVTTGILVIYADETSFSFMTPEGHMFGGLNTFSAEHTEDRGTVVRIRMLVRTADPSWELLWPVLKASEGRFWRATLANVAAANGVPDAVVEEATVCVDRGRLWRNWRNVFRNGALVTLAHVVGRRSRARRGGDR